jgi:hypothetical protein
VRVEEVRVAGRDHHVLPETRVLHVKETSKGPDCGCRTSTRAIVKIVPVAVVAFFPAIADAIPAGGQPTIRAAGVRLRVIVEWTVIALFDAGVNEAVAAHGVDARNARVVVV